MLLALIYWYDLSLSQGKPQKLVVLTFERKIYFRPRTFYAWTVCMNFVLISTRRIFRTFHRTCQQFDPMKGLNRFLSLQFYTRKNQTACFHSMAAHIRINNYFFVIKQIAKLLIKPYSSPDIQFFCSEIVKKSINCIELMACAHAFFVLSMMMVAWIFTITRNAHLKRPQVFMDFWNTCNILNVISNWPISALKYIEVWGRPPITKENRRLCNWM